MKQCKRQINGQRTQRDCKMYIHTEKYKDRFWSHIAFVLVSKTDRNRQTGYRWISWCVWVMADQWRMPDPGGRSWLEDRVHKSNPLHSPSTSLHIHSGCRSSGGTAHCRTASNLQDIAYYWQNIIITIHQHTVHCFYHTDKRKCSVTTPKCWAS